MSFAGGVFSRLYNFTADAAASIPAQPARFDNELAGIATGLSTCLLRDGSQTVIANIPMGGFKITGLGVGNATGQAITFDQIAASGGAALIGVAAGGTLQAALGGFISAASPAFTGTPLAPTAAVGTNTTQIATTAFVTAAIGTVATLASPTFIGTPSAPTAAAGTNTTQIATTAFVQANGGMGVSSQAWANVTVSRTFTTVYTNSTGRGIQVCVSLFPGSSNLNQAVTVGGVLIATIPNFTGSGAAPFTFDVPAGATYSVATGAGAPGINSWVEMR